MVYCIQPYKWNEITGACKPIFSPKGTASQYESRKQEFTC
ncbi:9146_t:CDS:2 [Entrophospora sp. SA101]|nr:9146_t:CDS:2 [Entrophospora sp. SA101]